MSALYDMISTFIAMLMSAAFLHFGAAGESRPAPEPSPTASSAAPTADPVADTRDDSRPLPAHRRCHGHAGVQPALDALRAPSLIRRG